MKKILCITLVLIFIGWAGTAMAAPLDGYFGGGFGRTAFEDDDRFAGDFLDDDDKGFQIYGGFRLTAISV